MFKKFFSLLIIFFLIYSIQLKAVSYDNYDGRYRYTQSSEMPSASYYESMQEEEILLIVDYSASMNQSFGVSTRYFQALDAINNILNNIPADAKVGLRVFGITSSPAIVIDENGIGRFNRSEACSASKLVSPISSYNLSNISSALSSYSPKGATPIGYSLREAIKNDFSYSFSSIKHIILITDGGENCGDDPCRYIKRIMEQRRDLKIDVIGITIGNNAYSQLSCIANAANGRFYNVNSQIDFNNAFKNIFSQVSFKAQQPQATVNAQTTTTGGFAPYKPETVQPQVQPIVEIPPKPAAIKYNNYSFEFDM